MSTCVVQHGASECTELFTDEAQTALFKDPARTALYHFSSRL